MWEYGGKMTQGNNSKNYNIVVILFATAILITLYGGIKGSLTIMLIGIFAVILTTPFYFRNKFSYYSNIREAFKKIIKRI